MKTGVPPRVPWVRIPPLPPVPCSPLLAAVTGSAEDLDYSGRPRNRRPMLKLKAWERRDKARIRLFDRNHSGEGAITDDAGRVYRKEIVNGSVGSSNENKIILSMTDSYKTFTL
jgi:hypothetical protein